ncbi:MAG: hypothetical protein A4E61_01600 [Syntrophorhabdus sp. PtaB.Bin184]|nr:MAG: hypothetical protein A4E61_01600 [Syntrophorhabdus sp. PtaB.Bin184]
MSRDTVIPFYQEEMNGIATQPGAGLFHGRTDS